MDNCYIAFAPLQGYTDAAYRRAHWDCAGGVDEYYMPFVRLENGEPRRKDMRDAAPERNAGVPTVAQVIARDGDEFAQLCDALQGQGWQRIDLNLGCPFPMQTRAGRGSGLLQHPDRIEAICHEMQRRPEVVFSVKMRLGQTSLDEGLAAMPIVNAMPLTHVTIHPRLGQQQYKGSPDLRAFAQMSQACTHPVVYNGDITGVESGEWKVSTSAGPTPSILHFPLIKGVMLGRGLLARPWMLSSKEPREVLREMHAAVYRHATATYCGDSQILVHLHAFWEYLDIPQKQKKALLKSPTLRRYDEAVGELWSAMRTPIKK